MNLSPFGLLMIVLSLFLLRPVLVSAIEPDPKHKSDCRALILATREIPDFSVERFHEFLHRIEVTIRQNDTEGLLKLIDYPFLLIIRGPAKDRPHFLENAQDVRNHSHLILVAELLERLANLDLDQLETFTGQVNRVFSVRERGLRGNEVLRFHLSTAGDFILTYVEYSLLSEGG